jgi:hypothetical protein
MRTHPSQTPKVSRNFGCAAPRPERRKRGENEDLCGIEGSCLLQMVTAVAAAAGMVVVAAAAAVMVAVVVVLIMMNH